MFEDDDIEVWISAASVWEAVIKSTTRGDPPQAVIELLRAELEAGLATVLPVTERHAFHVASLPLHHRDPFDRLLIAQSQLEGMPILTNDAAFHRYNADIRW
jgi:PIN domain nuclease of toxin-antitoxin system